MMTECTHLNDQFIKCFVCPDICVCVVVSCDGYLLLLLEQLLLYILSLNVNEWLIVMLM